MPCSVLESVPADVESCRAIIGDEPCAVSGLRWDRWCSSSSRQGRLRALFRGGSRAGASARRSSASSLCDGLAPRSSCWGCCHSSVHLRVSLWDGLGTPAPIAPPTNLVVTGFYRRVRNPIYVALLIILLGEALLFGDERVTAWGVLFWLFTDVRVYFCDPQSPWQRGTNENTNRLLRQYFPKGTDLSPCSQADLNRTARQLNQRPRKTLAFRSPAEVFNESVALTG